MKIGLHTIWGVREDFIGGTERFVINLARMLQRQGHEPFVLCSNLEEEIEVNGVPVLGRPPNKYHSRIASYGGANEHFFRREILGNTPSLEGVENLSAYVEEQCLDIEADSLHINSWLASTFLSNELLARSVLTNHECDEELAHYWGIDKSFEQTLLNHWKRLKLAKATTTDSDHYANYLQSNAEIEVFSIPIGNFLDDIPIVPQSTEKPKRTILLPARFDPDQKGHYIALEAVARLKKTRPNVQLVCTGLDSGTYGRHKVAFDQRTNELGLSDSVQVLRVDDMRTAYAIADAVISPERFCSYGLAVSESIASGIPSVISGIPTYREIAGDTPYAHVCDTFTPTEFASKLNVALSQQVKPEDVIKFRERTDIANTAQTYTRLYEK